MDTWHSFTYWVEHNRNTYFKGKVHLVIFGDISSFLVHLDGLTASKLHILPIVVHAMTLTFHHWI